MTDSSTISDSATAIPGPPSGARQGGTRGYYSLLVLGVVLGGISLVALISLTTPLQFVIVGSLLALGIAVVRALKARGRMVSLLLPLALVLAGAAAVAAGALYVLPDEVAVFGAATTFLGAFDLLFRAWETRLPSSSRGSWWDAIKVLGLMFSIAVVYFVARAVDPYNSMVAGASQDRYERTRLHEWMVTDTVRALSADYSLTAEPCLDAVRAAPAFGRPYRVEARPHGPGGSYEFDLVSAGDATAECSLRPVNGSAGVERRLSYSYPQGIPLDSLGGGRVSGIGPVIQALLR